MREEILSTLEQLERQEAGEVEKRLQVISYLRSVAADRQAELRKHGREIATVHQLNQLSAPGNVDNIMRQELTSLKSKLANILPPFTPYSIFTDLEAAYKRESESLKEISGDLQTVRNYCNKNSLAINIQDGKIVIV